MISLWFITAALSSLLLQIPPSQGVLVDKIVAIINDTDIITLSEVKQAMASKLLRLLLSPQGTPGEDKVLQHLVENKLILQEIGYLSHRSVEPVELEVALRWVMQEYGWGSPTSPQNEFRRTLEKEAITKEELEDLLEPQLRGIEYIRRKNRFRVDIQDPEKVLQLFEEWLKELKNKGNVQYPQ